MNYRDLDPGFYTSDEKGGLVRIGAVDQRDDVLVGDAVPVEELKCDDPWGQDSIYNSPDRYALELIGSVDTGGSYEFDIFAVFRDTRTGDLFTASDAGCSCPSPFEYQTRADLVGPVSFHDVADAIMAHAHGSEYDSDADREYWKADAVTLIARLRELTS